MSIVKFARSLLFTGFAIVSTAAALPAHSSEFALVDHSCGQNSDCGTVAEQQLILICDGDGTVKHCQIVKSGSELLINSPLIMSIGTGQTTKCNAKDDC